MAPSADPQPWLGGRTGRKWQSTRGVVSYGDLRRIGEVSVLRRSAPRPAAHYSHATLMTPTRRNSGPHWAWRVLVLVVSLGVSAWWVLFADVDKGRILYMFSPNHGIDESDLLTIPFLL